MSNKFAFDKPSKSLFTAQCMDRIRRDVSPRNRCHYAIAPTKHVFDEWVRRTNAGPSRPYFVGNDYQRIIGGGHPRNSVFHLLDGFYPHPIWGNQFYAAFVNDSEKRFDPEAVPVMLRSCELFLLENDFSLIQNACRFAASVNNHFMVDHSGYVSCLKFYRLQDRLTYGKPICPFEEALLSTPRKVYSWANPNGKGFYFASYSRFDGIEADGSYLFSNKLINAIKLIGGDVSPMIREKSLHHIRPQSYSEPSFHDLIELKLDFRDRLQILCARKGVEFPYEEEVPCG